MCIAGLSCQRCHVEGEDCALVDEAVGTVYSTCKGTHWSVASLYRLSSLPAAPDVLGTRSGGADVFLSAHVTPLSVAQRAACPVLLVERGTTAGAAWQVANHRDGAKRQSVQGLRWL